MVASEFNTQQAETIALKALEFVLADSKLQGAFLANSGLSPKDIHASMSES